MAIITATKYESYLGSFKYLITIMCLGTDLLTLSQILLIKVL